MDTRPEAKEATLARLRLVPRQARRGAQSLQGTMARAARESSDWRGRAACLTADPDLFFPISDTGPGERQEAKAKAVCARCPVQPECLAFALRTAETQGIWGGQTPRERLLTARVRSTRSHGRRTAAR